MHCKFSNINATFTSPRISVSVTSLGIYKKLFEMADDTGTISGNLPRLFMSVLAGELLWYGGVCLDALPPQHYIPVMTPVPHELPLSRPTCGVVCEKPGLLHSRGSRYDFRGMLNIPFVHLRQSRRAGGVDVGESMMLCKKASGLLKSF